jgi:hypothetical protein
MGPVCCSNAVVLQNTLRVYGCAVFFPGHADAWGVRFAGLVADAGSACACTPPDQHEPSSTTNPARGADLEMHPCPA